MNGQERTGKVRIALFHTTLPQPGRKPGGVDVVVDRLARAMARQEGAEVTVFSLTPAPSDASYGHHQLFRNSPWLYQRSLARYLLLPFLLNLVDFGDHDVLHLHGDDWFYWRRRLPTVRTMHGSALREARAATSLKKAIAQRLIYLLEYLAVRLATVATAVGRDTAAIYGIVEQVDNGVDLERFHPGSKTPHPSVLFVGTLEGRKRGRWLSEVFITHVLPVVPGAKLWFVSDAFPEHPDVVPVRAPGDEELADLYRRAWVLACASTYEGFGVPYLEAMASGTAIVTTPNTGAADVLELGRYGILADDASFPARLVGLLQDSSLRDRLTTAGRSRAELFEWSRVAARHLEIFAQAMRRWNARRRSQPPAA
jgi:glycosyltransferase involved in cell wall biosynthesis